VSCKDEGVRMLCKFLQKDETVTIVDVMGNGITSLGCEFFGQMLQPAMNEVITILKLDHNPIGSDGLGELARGLATNKSITVTLPTTPNNPFPRLYL